MTHETESTYQDRVEQFLVDEYGVDNVDRERYLEATGRYCDFWVQGPVVDLAIEVENDADAILKGTGQALLYAAHAHGAVPVVITPPGHVEQPEMDYLRERVAIVELDV